MRKFFKTGKDWYFGELKVEVTPTLVYSLSEEGDLRVNFTSISSHLCYDTIDVIVHDMLYVEKWHSQNTDSIRPIVVAKTRDGKIFLSWFHIEWNIRTNQLTSAYSLGSVCLNFLCSYLGSRVILRSHPDSPYQRSNGTVHVNLWVEGKRRTLLLPYVWWNPTLVDSKTVRWL